MPEKHATTELGRLGHMPTNILTYESTPRPFVIPDGDPTHSEQVGRLRVTENSVAGEPRLYQLRMTADVHTREEAEACHSEALSVADDLDVVWTYVAGQPLFPYRMVLQIREAPNGWTTDYKEVRSQLPSASRFTYEDIRFVSGPSYVELPFMPLQPAMALLHSYRSADQNTRLLTSLHYEAIGQRGSQAGLFLLAKALELAKLILPGRTDNQKQKALSSDVQSELSQSLHWLYDIANNRLEIRHVVGTKTLLPRITAAERKDFLANADLVIRGVVQRELGGSLAILRTR